jgi:hypothetical protein
MGLNPFFNAVIGSDGGRKKHDVAMPVYPTSEYDAMVFYRQLAGERAYLQSGGLTRTEKKRVGTIQAILDGLKAALPEFDPTKRYEPPAPGGVEAADTERPATLSEIQALANTLPIASLGAQGSNAPPLTSEQAATGISRNTWITLGVVGAVLIGAILLFFRK